MHNNIITRLGVWISTLIITGFSVLVSVGITVLILLLTGNQVRLVSISIPVVVPLVIAPPVVFFYGKLLFKISQLEEKMRILATYDTLTELLSRHAIIEKAATLLYLEKRNKKAFSVLYCDIDHFKNINDTYGHETGDHVLQETAGVIKKSIRESDLAGRLGGEEFLVVLPDTNTPGAISVSLKLKKQVESHVFNFNDTALSITISIGVCDSENLGTYDLDRLINQADKCLYHSKENGRNRITVWEQGKYTIVKS